MLYREWDSWIRGGFCQQLKKMGSFSDEQLDDVAQQFYVDILGKGEKFFTSYNQPEAKTPEAGYKSWLGICIRNAAVNYVRRLKWTNAQLSLVEAAEHEDFQRLKGTISAEDIESLQAPCEQGEEAEIKNLMVRLRRRLHNEGERVLLVCALLYKGLSPTEIARRLARERAKSEGVTFDKLSEKEQQRRLSQCKPLVSQYRARIQDKAAELDMFSTKSVERAACRVFKVGQIDMYTRPWQFVLWYCRKHGIATFGELVERYADEEDDRTALDTQIRSIVTTWGNLPATSQVEIQGLEAQM